MRRLRCICLSGILLVAMAAPAGTRAGEEPLDVRITLERTGW